MRLPLGLLLLVVLLGAQFGCASYPKFPVDAPLLNQRIETTVDSSQAQYYLNHYLQGRRLDPLLDAEIDKTYRDFPAPLPSREDLRLVAERFSNDFAALFLADRLWQSQRNRLVQATFSRYLSLPEEDLYRPISESGSYTVLLVPGWNYVRNGHVTGSDFAAPRRLIDRMGVENELVEVPPNGSVQQSAEVIAAAIKTHSARGRRLIVVGASAAGPAIHYTLGSLLEHDQLRQVAAWINIGGILQGSPLVDHFQRWPQKLLLNLALVLLGWDNEEIMTLSAAQSRQRSQSLRLPPDLLVINYLGLSLTGSLSSLSDYKYSLLAEEGPNDGLTPLVDIVAPGGLTLVAPLSDHYFGEDPEIDHKTIAMLKTVLELASRPLAD